MKRILACFLVLILVSVSVFATADQISGGWSVSVTAGSLKLDKEARQALKKASETYTGAKLVPLALLGKQIVAGTNYCILCHSTTSTLKPVKSLCLVYVYQDLNNKAEITKIKTLKLKYKPAGGWKISNSVKKLAVESQAKKALKTAAKELVGAEYKPLLVLGRDNSKKAYCLLCRCKKSDQAGTVSLSLVYLRKVDGKFTIKGISDLKIAR